MKWEVLNPACGGCSTFHLTPLHFSSSRGFVDFCTNTSRCLHLSFNVMVLTVTISLKIQSPASVDGPSSQVLSVQVHFLLVEAKIGAIRYLPTAYLGTVPLLSISGDPAL
jgi:hypothetical protein